MHNTALDDIGSTPWLTAVLLCPSSVASFPGESDAGSPALYACEQRALIQDLRNKYDNARLSFHWVLLAAYQPHVAPGWAPFRAAQLSTLDVPYTGYASAIDLGDPTSPWGGVHSRHKREVGERIARSLMAVNYGADVQWKGSQMAAITWPLSNSGAVVIAYDSRDAGNQGLHLNDTQACDDCCTRGQAFAVLTSEGKAAFANATTVYADAFVVVVQALLPPGVSVAGLLYNYEMYPQCALYNGEGLPQAPFQRLRYGEPTAPQPRRRERNSIATQTL